MSDRCSPGSAGLTTGSQPPDIGTCSSASPTRTDGTCSQPAGPECPSTTTYAAFARATTAHGPLGGELDDERWEETDEAPPLTVHSAGQRMLISSAEDSPARTSPSPADAPGSTENGQASSSSSPASPTLFDPDGYSSRTFPVSSLARAVGTSESCLPRWPTSGTAWRGGFSTHVSSECRSAADACSSSEPSLTEILEPPQSVPGKYSLSARAANGILRRAERRGRTLPPHLQRALWLVAQTRKAWAPVTPGWLRYLALERVARTTTTGREAG
jgi:hypothetical protein